MKKLRAGDKAPEFDAKDIRDNTVKVNNNGKWTFLSFHRFAACPLCNLRTNELITAYDKLQTHNIDVISLWPSTTENMLKFVGNQTTPFPLISDAKKAIYEKYGVTESSPAAILKLLIHPRQTFKALKYKYKDEIIDSDQGLLPAEFIIDPDGKISVAHYGTHYGDHISIDKIIESCKEVSLI